MSGYSDPRETVAIPDVTLTGDEFLHMLAVVGELIPGAEPCHSGPDIGRGFWKPGCPACVSIMTKAAALDRACRSLGL